MKKELIPTLMTILFILSYYLWPLDTSPKAAFYACFGLAALSTAIFRFKPHAFSKSLVGLSLLLVLYILTSTLWASAVSPSGNFLYHSKRAAEIIALVTLIAAFFDARYHGLLLKGCVAVACIHALFLIPGHHLGHRLTNPIDTGMVYGIAAVIALFFALDEQRINRSIVYFCAFSLLVTILLITKSRGPQLALLCASTVLMAIRYYRWKRLAIYAATMSCLCLLLFYTTDIFTKVFSRGFDVSMRDIIWRETITNGLNHFWFGLGMEKKVLLHLSNGHSFTHSHNFMLDTFRLTGAIGLLLIVALFIYALYLGFKSPDNDLKLWALVLLFGSLCLMTNGSIPFNRPSHAWLAFWVPVAMIASRPRRDPLPTEEIL